MALKINEFKELAHAYANADKSAAVAYSFNENKYSYKDLETAFASQFKELAGDYNSYRRNKNDVFELIEIAVDEFLPKRVDEYLGLFSEVSQINDGDRAVFKLRITEAARKRAKAFVTTVGIAGRYEVFKLAGSKYEIVTGAIGGAAQIAFEDFLEGRVNFTELVDIVMEGIADKINELITDALESLYTKLWNNSNNNNRTATYAGFQEAAMDKLLMVADAYGESTLFCTMEFAQLMVPSTGWISNGMKDARWANGYLGNYKGHNVVILKQSFTDETNAVKVVDPQYCYVIPGGAEKPVKVVFEGQTHTKEVESQDDWSRHIDIFKKVGVGLVGLDNGICVYQNTALSKNM